MTELLFLKKRAGRDKLPQQLVKEIRDYVLEGHLKPGDKLPSEQELIQIFSISRQTIREALRALEIQGLLSIRPGARGGAFVREVDIDVTRQSLINFFHHTDLSLRHISELRKMLDPHLAEVAAGMDNATIVETLAVTLKEQEHRLSLGDLPGARKAEIRFHRDLAKISDNPLLVLLQDFIESLLENLKSQLNPSVEFSEHSLAMHKDIFEAIKRHDAEGAREAILKDVISVEKDLLALGAQKRWDNLEIAPICAQIFGNS